MCRDHVHILLFPLGKRKHFRPIICILHDSIGFNNLIKIVTCSPQNQINKGRVCFSSLCGTKTKVGIFIFYRDQKYI